MIYTITLNPAIDMTIYLDKLQKGMVNRSNSWLTDAGGKGVNVSKFIKVLGGESVVMGFIGNENKDWFFEYLKNMGIAVDFISVAGITRTNIKIVETAEKVYTDINQSGFEVSDNDIVLFFEKLETLASSEDIFVLSGSLPSGANEDLYEQLIKILKRKGATVIFDADSKALARGILEKPDVIKPNIYEFKSIFNVNEDDIPSIVRTAKKVVKSGVKLILVSMGERGSIFVTENSSIVAPAIKVDAKSTTGAGDAMVAALAFGLSQHMSDEDMFKLAVACATAKVLEEGVKPPKKEEIDRFFKTIELERLVGQKRDFEERSIKI